MSLSFSVHLQPGFVLWIPYYYAPLITTCHSQAIALVQPVFNKSMALQDKELFTWIAEANLNVGPDLKASSTGSNGLLLLAALLLVGPWAIKGKYYKQTCIYFIIHMHICRSHVIAYRIPTSVSEILGLIRVYTPPWSLEVVLHSFTDRSGSEHINYQDLKLSAHEASVLRVSVYLYIHLSMCIHLHIDIDTHIYIYMCHVCGHVSMRLLFAQCCPNGRKSKLYSFLLLNLDSCDTVSRIGRLRSKDLIVVPILWRRH